MRVLTLDIGSSSVKGAVWDGRRFLHRVRVEFQTRLDSARAEVDAKELQHAVMGAGKEAAGAHSVDAVAFCVFSPGVVVIDRHGRARTAVITHADRRSTHISQALVRERPKKWWLDHTGNLPYPGGIGSSTLAYLRQQRASVFGRKYRVGQASSLIGSWLTREWVIDPSQAMFLGLWDIRNREWSKEVCKVVGVDVVALPQVRFADDVVGKLAKDTARTWGLTEGLPVIGGFVDTSASILATGMRQGQIVHSVGSTEVMAMCVASPTPQEGILTRPIGVGNIFHDRWLAVRTQAAAGSALDWVRQTMFAELEDRAWSRVVKRVAADQNAGRVTCDASFTGQRVSIDQSEGAAFAGVRLSTTREEMLAAVIRALVQFSVGSHRRLAELCPPLKNVYVSGGASPLANAMHREWPGKHDFQRLPGDNLTGLVILARKVLNG